jgi:ribosomal protein L21E
MIREQFNRYSHLPEYKKGQMVKHWTLGVGVIVNNNGHYYSVNFYLDNNNKPIKNTPTACLWCEELNII